VGAAACALRLLHICMGGIVAFGKVLAARRFSIIGWIFQSYLAAQIPVQWVALLLQRKAVVFGPKKKYCLMVLV